MDAYMTYLCRKLSLNPNSINQTYCLNVLFAFTLALSLMDSLFFFNNGGLKSTHWWIKSGNIGRKGVIFNVQHQI